MITSLKDILVVTDMDNTLLTAEQGIPQCNLSMIKLFRSLGGKFTVASGRTVDSVGRYMDQLSLSTPAITYGGGVIYDYVEQKRIKNATLPKPTAKRALLDIQQAFPGIGIEIMADNGRLYVVQGNEYTHRHTFYERLKYLLSTVAEIKTGWNKVLFACENETLLQIEKFVAQREYPGVYFVATNSIYFEIMPQNVTKGSALRELCAYLNIPVENTIAIGDYYNDIELMRAAGHAVAMGNAPDTVKEIAHDVTGNCTDGGVAQYLYRLIQKYT